MPTSQHRAKVDLSVDLEGFILLMTYRKRMFLKRI